MILGIVGRAGKVALHEPSSRTVLGLQCLGGRFLVSGGASRGRTKLMAAWTSIRRGWLPRAMLNTLESISPPV